MLYLFTYFLLSEYILTSIICISSKYIFLNQPLLVLSSKTFRITALFDQYFWFQNKCLNTWPTNCVFVFSIVLFLFTLSSSNPFSVVNICSSWSTCHRLLTCQYVFKVCAQISTTVHVRFLQCIVIIMMSVIYVRYYVCLLYTSRCV